MRPSEADTARRSCGNESLAGSSLGRAAYLRDGTLRLVDLGTCRERVLARHAEPPVRFSADGRWIAFGSAQIVPAVGGRVFRPFPTAASSPSWAWSPRRHQLALVTKGGGILLGGPGRRPRRVLREGWGAQQVMFTPDGSLAVARSLFPRARAANYRQEIWLFAGPKLTPNRVFSLRRGLAPPELATWSPREPDWVFFWRRPQNSNSLAADGLPLYVKGATAGAGGHLVARAMLGYDDFLSWCRDDLVIVAGADRYATHDKRLVVASPPAPAGGQSWRRRELSGDASRSWVSPACSADGRLVAAGAGPNGIERRFGLERRAIWLLSLEGRTRRQLTAPPRGLSDEFPRWSADGRVLLFVRSGPTNREAVARGALYLVRLDNGHLLGPLALIGPAGNYYGHYGWFDTFDWYRR